ncbi:class D sortase [Paenibacillus sp. 1011MAR3C5]|uniref:class D sortase n=1 Tax=Paenibacillus sp. 1011MAR3C5 TaxID=1675787 RepID=UPI000E6CE09E|nr:class D sortase [Paenibacillus sp. 1011MAR3C5]RJE84669.1 class D sortase [Paenibacillus sp. 1011MAR3C5]
MKRLLSYGLIIIGLLIIVYPRASAWLDDRQQEKLMAQWEESVDDEQAQQEALDQYDRLSALFAEEAESETVEADETSEPSDTPAPSNEPPKLNAIATIRIPSIKVNLPVLEGATQKNMKYAAAHLKETAPIGAVGNAAIAAHRMRAKGKLFNRLNEVKEGDKIIVETQGETYTYVVTGTSIVEPTDVSVLNYNKTDRRLTLITCDPVVNPTHRLIVHAEIA